MDVNHAYTPQIIAIEGLDGVGKTTVTRALTELTDGVDITDVIMASMGTSRQTIVDSDSVDARFHYWLAVDYLAGEYARECITSKRMAIIDSYFFRTIAGHMTFEVAINSLPLLSKAVRPDRAVLLTVPEQVRVARLRERDMGKQETAWHTELASKWREVLSTYRTFGLTEIDSSDSPRRVAEQILESKTAQYFRFGTEQEWV